MVRYKGGIMDNKYIHSNDAYERMMQEKEDANMRYVAQIVHEEYYMPTEEELAQVQVPEELHNKMLSLAREYDKKREKAIIKKRISRLSKMCAVFLVCFAVVGTFTITSADAVKVKLKGLLPWFEEDHVVLNPYDYSELERWTDYYIFSELPVGYVLSYVEKTDVYKKQFFLNEGNVITLTEYPLDTKTYLDIENFEVEELVINGEKSFFLEDDQAKSLYLMKEKAILHIQLFNNNEMDKSEIIALAEKIIFIN